MSETEATTSGLDMLHPTETPKERVMRQWYQMKIAERTGQFGNMLQNFSMLRRGAKKQQDGTLGQSGGAEDVGDEPMQISVGDTYMTVHQSAETGGAEAETDVAQPSNNGMSTAQKLALGTAIALGLGGGGLGIGTLIASLVHPDTPTQEFVDTDTDTQYELFLGQPID